MAHHLLADECRGHLLFARFLQLALDLANHRLEPIQRHWALFTGLFQAGENLLAVKGLAPTIFLDDERIELLDSLVGGKSALALQALASAANDRALVGLTRVDHLVLRFLTKRATHRPEPASAFKDAKRRGETGGPFPSLVHGPGQGRRRRWRGPERCRSSFRSPPSLSCPFPEW